MYAVHRNQFFPIGARLVKGTSFDTRSQLAEALALGWRLPNGSVVTAGDLSYTFDNTAGNPISGLPGVVPGGRWRPEHFGETGAGVNSAVAINAAILAKSIAGGGHIYLTPSKVYEHTSTISMHPGITLRGEGATIKRADLSGGYNSVNLGAEGVKFHFRDIIFDENRDGQSTDNHSGSCIALNSAGNGVTTGSDDVALIKCTIKNFSRGGMGFHPKGFKKCRIQDCLFEDGGLGLYHPIYTRRVGSHIVTNNILKDVRGHAIKLDANSPAEEAVVHGNIIDGCGNGIYCTSVSKVNITGNIIKNCVASGIVVIKGNDPINIDQISVTGNTVEKARGGIILINARDFTLTGNVFKDMPLGFSFRNCLRGQITGNMLQIIDLSHSVLDPDGNLVVASTLDKVGVEIQDGPSNQFGIIFDASNQFRCDVAGTSTCFAVAESNGWGILHGEYDTGRNIIGWDTVIDDPHNWLLLDYYKGTFVPQYTTSEGAFTAQTNNGTFGEYHYDRISGIVRVWGYHETDNIDNTVGRSGAAQVRISGLPYKSANASGRQSYPVTCTGLEFQDDGFPVGGIIPKDEAYVIPLKMGTSGVTPVVVSDLRLPDNTSNRCRFQATYQAESY